MNTPAVNDLARQRMAEICWWLKPENQRLRRDLVGVVWESLRRTRAFRAFFDKARAIKRSALATHPPGSALLIPAIVSAVRQLIFANKPAGVRGPEWLPLGEHDPIQKWSDLFFRNCEPELDWLQLGHLRRHSVRFNSPLLPRQERAEGYSTMDIVVCELERDPKDGRQESIKRAEWGTSLPMKPRPDSGICVLPEGVQHETYVAVIFELGQPAEALERQVEGELAWRLFPGDRNGQPCDFMDRGDAAYIWQSDVPPGKMVYPKLWIEALDPNARIRTQESVVKIPGRQSPYAMCWIPARNDWKQLQSRFHTAVREENRPDLEKVCTAYWALPEKVPGLMGGPEQVLPPWPDYRGVSPQVKRKPADLAEFWMGLAAYDYRQAGVRFDKSPAGRDALAFFTDNGMPCDPDLIRPALASFKNRLREIDGLYSAVV